MPAWPWAGPSRRFSIFELRVVVDAFIISPYGERSNSRCVRVLFDVTLVRSEKPVSFAPGHNKENGDLDLRGYVLVYGSRYGAECRERGGKSIFEGANSN